MRRRTFIGNVPIVPCKSPVIMTGDVVFGVQHSFLSSANEGRSIDTALVRIGAICFYEPWIDQHRIIDDDEPAILSYFWRCFESLHADGKKMVGLNLYDFELPLILRHSWLLGVPVPESATAPAGCHFWNETFVDLMTVWNCGRHPDEMSLDWISQCLGIDSEIDGADEFQRLCVKKKRDGFGPLMRDVTMAYRCANKMGVVGGATWQELV